MMCHNNKHGILFYFCCLPYDRHIKLIFVTALHKQERAVTSERQSKDLIEHPFAERET